MKRNSLLMCCLLLLGGCHKDSPKNAEVPSSIPSGKADGMAVIKGAWQTDPKNSIYIFDPDGSYLLMVHTEKEILVRDGRWRRVDLRIFERKISDIIQGEIKVRYFSNVPTERDDKEVDGYVYGFGDGPDSDSILFAYFADSDSIKIDHGDYSHFLVRAVIDR